MSQDVAKPGSTRRIVGGRSGSGAGLPAEVARILSKPAGAGIPAQLPGVGQTLFGFRLRQELGRGAFAAVFLAEQADLARRPVVLKVSGIAGNEPQTLAQLQHTHIVPIHSVHEDKETGLRAVCMPYFGGAALSRVLRTVWDKDKRPARGELLVQALAEVGSPLAVTGSARPTPTDPGPLQTLSGLDFIRASVWIVARLAEALQHAHQRGILHRDIKPSNILLAADGQPMLLDFNLAQNHHGGHAQASALLGGTVAYMAPEHLRALATRDPAHARQVDRRSDIYSLGMVLYEMLAGCKPFDQSGSYSPLLSLIEAMALERSRSSPSLRQQRTDVPWGLESIARKCLDPDPAKRYQQAEELAEDLRRFLAEQPLKYAPELSRAERVRKWVRRHPRLTSSASVATVAALLLVAAGATLLGVHKHLAHTREQLQTVQAQERKRAYEEGTTRALCLVNTVTTLPEHLPQGRTVCEETLALYDVLNREDWQAGASWQRLAPDERRVLAEDTRELLLLLAWARVRLAGGKPDSLRDALRLLDRAEAVDGLTRSRALWEDRADYLGRLGDGDAARMARRMAEQIQPVSARDHYLLATAYARASRYAEAIAELDEALRLNPRDYWAAVQKGICHQELGQYDLAAADFGACVGLWPEFAWGYFNRGYALYRCGKKTAAVNDYTAALERDPAFVLAHLNRGMVRLELRQYTEALADFQKATELGRDDAALHAGRGAALEGLLRPAEADAAFQTAFARPEAATPDVGARIRLVYGFAVAARLPDKARQAFDEILRQPSPYQGQALYGRAMVLVEQGQTDEALLCFNQAVEAAPNLVEARRFRAVLLARRHDFAGASQDINWCLEREPDAGPTLYAAACVAARAVNQLPDPLTAKPAADQAITFLQKAFARGYGRDKAAQDPDLSALRGYPQFRQLVGEQEATDGPLSKRSLPGGRTPTD